MNYNSCQYSKCYHSKEGECLKIHTHGIISVAMFVMPLYIVCMCTCMCIMYMYNMYMHTYIHTYSSNIHTSYSMVLLRAAHRGGGGGGGLGNFSPGPSLKGAPGGPTKGPLNTCLKDRYTLVEQSDLNTLIE